MFPDRNDVKNDKILTTIALQYKSADFLSEKIMPVLNVDEYSGIFYEFDKSDMELSNSIRGPGDEAKQVGFGLRQSTYGPLVDHALKIKIPRKKLKLWPKAFSAFEQSTSKLKNRLMVSREYNLATYMNSTTNLTNNTTLSGTAQWSDYDNSNPVADIDAAKETVRGKIFVVPNTLILSYATYLKLIHHPDLLERFKYSERGVLNIEHLKAIFGVEKVWVGAARYVTSKEGQSTVTTADLWGKNAWVGYTTDTIVPDELTFGATLMMNDETYAKKWWDEGLDSWWVEAGETYEQKVIANDAMFLIKNAIA